MQTNSTAGGGSVKVFLNSRKQLFRMQTEYAVLVTASTEAANPSNGEIVSSSLILPIQIIIPNTGPPTFTKSLDIITLSVNDFYALILPSITDPDDVPRIFSLDFGQASSFVTGKYPRFLIQPVSNLTDFGTFQMSVTLTDDNPSPKQTTYTSVIKVNPLPTDRSGVINKN